MSEQIDIAVDLVRRSKPRKILSTWMRMGVAAKERRGRKELMRRRVGEDFGCDSHERVGGVDADLSVGIGKELNEDRLGRSRRGAKSLQSDGCILSDARLGTSFKAADQGRNRDGGIHSDYPQAKCGAGLDTGIAVLQAEDQRLYGKSDVGGVGQRRFQPDKERDGAAGNKWIGEVVQEDRQGVGPISASAMIARMGTSPLYGALMSLQRSGIAKSAWAPRRWIA